MQPLQPPPGTPHASHDLLLLAAAADRDPDPALTAAADAQVAGCPECAALAAELRALMTGLAALPRSRPVPRDMRLSPEDAARVARGGFWRRLLRPFGEAGLPALRPLAAALTTLGLGGLLLTASPLGFGAGGASPASRDAGAPVFGPATSATAGPNLGPAGATAAPAGPAGSPANEQGNTAHLATPPPKAASMAPPTAGPGGSTGSGAFPGPVASSSATTFDGEHVPAAPSAGPSLPPLGWLSLGLLGAGLALFSLLVVARRIG